MHAIKIGMGKELKSGKWPPGQEEEDSFYSVFPIHTRLHVACYKPLMKCSHL